MRASTLDEALRTACAKVGVVYRDVPVDGKWHMADIDGDKRGRGDARIKIFRDGQGGFVHNWKANEGESFFADDGQQLSEAERYERDRRRAEAMREAEEELGRQRAEASTKAAAIWKAASPARSDHPYLFRKQVQPVENLRELPAGDVAGLLEYAPKSGGEELAGRLILAPVKIDGRISTLEMIDEAGRKSAIAGGAKAGGYWAAQKIPDGDGAGLRLMVAEGVATALSARAATGYPAIAALSCGNLDAVAKQMRAAYPSARIIVLADLGNGQSHAERAARAVGGLLALPNFGADRPEGATDFNDMAEHCGLASVAGAIASAKAISFEWPEPLPLVADLVADAYPVDALPGSLGAAVREVAAFVQCPIALAASSALSALSVVGQALVDVKRGPDLEGPVSLYLLSIAESGERKSECDRRFTSVLREWEAEQAELIRPELARYRAALDAWGAEREAHLLNIKNARTKGKSTDALRAALEQWETQKPEPVRSPHLLLESETAESLAWNLARPDGWPSGGILSSEAGIVFGGHAMRRDNIMQNLALLNKLWSGEPHRVGRRTSEQFTLSGARLTMGLAVQPEAVRTFFDESRGLARGTGFAARFLIAWPESTQGSRLYRNAPDQWPGLTVYQNRLRELLSKSITFDKHGELEPCSLDMDAQAFAAWRAFHDGVEQELRSGGELAEVRDVASKAPENVARVAALFHLFEHGPEGRVGAACVAAAVRLVTWHLFEARRFLGRMVLPEALGNAVKLEDWLVAACRQRGANGVIKRDVMRTGPNPVRRKVNLDTALNELVGLHRAKMDDSGRTNRLNPALLEARDGAS